MNRITYVTMVVTVTKIKEIILINNNSDKYLIIVINSDNNCNEQTKWQADANGTAYEA